MARSPKEKPRAFARGLPGWLRWDFSAAPPAAFSNLRLKTQKATAPTRGRLKKARDDGPRGFRRERLDFLFLVCSSEVSLLAATIWLEVPMTVEKQREVIRLWNQLRKLEGPAAEELRIQILECFSEKDLSGKETVKRAA
jgi:hypothetical protein